MTETKTECGISLAPGKLNQHKQAKDARRKLKAEHKLGFRKHKSSRPKAGDRPGSIVAIPLCDLTPEQFDFILRRAREFLPESKQGMINESSKNGLQKLTTTLGYDVAVELMSPKPDKARLIVLCDPMGQKRR